MRPFLYLLALVLILGCSRSPKTILYHVELHIDDSLSIPFLLEQDAKTEHFSIVNGSEYIDDLISTRQSDSIDLEHQVYNSSLRFKLDGDSISGYWYNREKGKYKMALSGWRSNSRFEFEPISSPLSGRWAVNFGQGENLYKAVGIFESSKGGVTGTFLTETGDYRYLAGLYDGQHLWLSTFDLAHAFLFKAEYKDSNLSGTFYSGHHYMENWQASLDPTADLTKADELVQLVDSNWTFKVRGLSEEDIGLNDPLFQSKALIIQIFGSWCPNCYDESRFLSSIYSKIQEDSVELLGVAFERTSDFAEARKKLEKFRTGLEIPYPLAFGGYASKDSARAVFPFLDRVVAFPTLIFYNSDHQLVGIHSGFSGPANKQAFEKTKSEILDCISRIIPE